MRGMRWFFLLLFIVGASAARVERFLTDAQQEQDRSGFVCSLENRNVTESSGVAVSQRQKGIYWTHNDSGDGPRLYAFDRNGADMGTYTLSGVEAVDWEDMASVLLDGKPYLYAGDIGDNYRSRKEVIVYRTVEPRAEKGVHTITAFETYKLKYPDGTHNCETLLITPNGDIQLIVKSTDGVCGVYHLDRPAKSGSYTLIRLGEFKLNSTDVFDRLTTGGDMAFGSKHVVVRTYRSAYVWPADDTRAWFKGGSTKHKLPFEIQGEAICFDIYRTGFVITTEGTPCRVSFVRWPRGG